jgi:hypothetical protein
MAGEALALYEQMRLDMRRHGYHFPPWGELSSAERLGWARIAERRVVDPEGAARR